MLSFISITQKDYVQVILFSVIFVLWLVKQKSTILVKFRFRQEYNKDPPYQNNIWQWYKQFQENGSMQKGKQQENLEH